MYDPLRLWGDKDHGHQSETDIQWLSWLAERFLNGSWKLPPGMTLLKEVLVWMCPLHQACKTSSQILAADTTWLTQSYQQNFPRLAESKSGHRAPGLHELLQKQVVCLHGPITYSWQHHCVSGKGDVSLIILIWKPWTQSQVSGRIYKVRHLFRLSEFWYHLFYQLYIDIDIMIFQYLGSILGHPLLSAGLRTTIFKMRFYCIFKKNHHLKMVPTSARLFQNP